LIGTSGKPIGTKAGLEPCSRQLSVAVADQGAFVPSLWRLEVANSLTVAVRRGRVEGGFRHAALTDLSELEILVDSQTDARAWNASLDIADRYRLTLYDAAYIELAQRRALPLATLDEDMRRAGADLRLELLGVD
jgi:predicted nucleic acid-binding protein